MENLLNGDPPAETNMDLWNNDKGRQIAKDFFEYAKQNNININNLSEKQIEDFIAGRVVQLMNEKQLITNPKDKRRSKEFDFFSVDFSKLKKPKNNLKKDKFFTLEDVKNLAQDVFNANSKAIRAQNINPGFPTREIADKMVSEGKLQYVHGHDGISEERYVTSAGKIWVEPYTRDDGTDVRGYYRSRPLTA